MPPAPDRASRDQSPPRQGATLHSPFAAFERNSDAPFTRSVSTIGYCLLGSMNPTDQGWLRPAGRSRLPPEPLATLRSSSPVPPTGASLRTPAKRPSRRLAGEFCPGAAGVARHAAHQPCPGALAPQLRRPGIWRVLGGRYGPVGPVTTVPRAMRALDHGVLKATAAVRAIAPGPEQKIPQTSPPASPAAGAAPPASETRGLTISQDESSGLPCVEVKDAAVATWPVRLTGLGSWPAGARAGATHGGRKRHSRWEAASAPHPLAAANSGSSARSSFAGRCSHCARIQQGLCQWSLVASTRYSRPTGGPPPTALARPIKRPRPIRSWRGLRPIQRTITAGLKPSYRPCTYGFRFAAHESTQVTWLVGDRSGLVPGKPAAGADTISESAVAVAEQLAGQRRRKLEISIRRPRQPALVEAGLFQGAGPAAGQTVRRCVPMLPRPERTTHARPATATHASIRNGFSRWRSPAGVGCGR